MSEELKKFDHVDLLFPSNYLRASDLADKRPTVTIESITPRQELMRQGGKKDSKPVMYFVGKEKGMILNKTNGYAIAEAHGPETTAWIGKQIVIKKELILMWDDKSKTMKQKDAIRVDVEATRKLASRQPKQEREPGQEG